MGNKLQLTRNQRRRLERQLRRTHDVRLYRRTLAVLECDRGKSLAEIARMLRMNRRSIQRWIEAYGELVDPDSLLDDDRSGRPQRWTEDCSEWLEALLARGPAELGYYAANWNVPLLRDPLAACTAERFSDDTIRRALRRLGYAWKRARYVLQPDPEREKKTSHSPGNPWFAVANRVVGGRRDRFAAVPSVARQLEPTRGTKPRFAVWPQRSPSRFRSDESPHGDTPLFAASSSEAGRLPGVFDRLASALSGVARCPAAGRRFEPYRRPFATTCRRLSCEAPLAAEAFTRTQSHGAPVGTRQEHRQCEHAIPHHRRTRADVP
jgi:transposase